MRIRALKILSGAVTACVAVGAISFYQCGSAKEIALQSPSLIGPNAVPFDDYAPGYEAEETAFISMSLGNAYVDINDYTFVVAADYEDIATEFNNTPKDDLKYDGAVYWLKDDVVLVSADTTNEQDQDEEDTEDDSEENESINLAIGDKVLRISYNLEWSLVKLDDGTQGYVKNTSLSSTEITPAPTATPTSTPTPTPKPATPTPKPSSSSGSSSSSSGSSGSSSGSSSSSSSSSSSDSGIKETAVSKTVYSSCALNTRSGPGISYSRLSTLSIGTAISVVAETDNGWYKSSSGYYVKASLTLENPPTPTPTPEPSNSGSSSSGDSDFASFIKSFIGCKYVYGGASPSEGFDCSGLVMYCYQTYYNISLPHGATSQSKRGYEVSRDEIQVGDIICFDRDGDGTMEHSALYVGNDTYVHAQGSATGVVASKFSSATGIAHIRRVL